MAPWLSFLPPSFFLLLNGLLADGTGLPGPSEPRVYTAAVIGMTTGKYPQLVPIFIFLQADDADVILISLLIVMCRDQFQLLLGQSIALELFLVLDTTK